MNIVLTVCREAALNHRSPCSFELASQNINIIQLSVSLNCTCIDLYVVIMVS